MSATGLPAGTTAVFSPTTVAGSGSSTATITVGGGVAAGSYPLTITGTSGSLIHSANVTLTVFVASGGALSGAVTTPSSTQQLTTQGTADWAHWGPGDRAGGYIDEDLAGVHGGLVRARQSRGAPE
jgi:hypothetical protein